MSESDTERIFRLLREHRELIRRNEDLLDEVDDKVRTLYELHLKRGDIVEAMPDEEAEG